MRRRRILAVLLPLLVVLLSLVDLSAAEPRIFTDAAGRRVELPDTIDRVMAAGPPASVLLYVLAPDKMAGWVRKPAAEAKEFLAEPYRDLPVLGRLTGKENTVDSGAVAAAETHDFYRLFYHVDLTQDQIDGLLAGSVPE